jgi:soluble lytic murein transglycosylase
VHASRLVVATAAGIAVAFTLACSSAAPAEDGTAPPSGALTPDASAAAAATAEATTTPSPDLDAAPPAEPSPTAGEPSPTASPAAAPEATPTPEPTPKSGSGETTAPRDVEEASRAGYRAALEARDGGDLDVAIAGFEAVRDGDGMLAPIAGLRLAQAVAQAERDAEAVDAFAIAVADPALPAALLHVARIEHAEALARLDRSGEALALLATAAVAAGAGTGDAAAARWRRAELLRESGDPLWVDEALAVVGSAPGTWQAAAALDALEASEVAVAAGQAAYVRYRNWDNVAATALYEGIAAAPATSLDAAAAWFYLGALAERRLDNAAAIEAYERSLDFDGEGFFADDARWWLGELLDDEGRPLEAVAHYDELMAGFPGSPFARDAALRAAIAVARSGDDRQAAARLRAIMAVGSAESAANAARWLGVFGLRADGDPLPADFDASALGAVLETSEDVTLAPGAAGEWGAPSADWDAAAAWLDARFGPRPASAGAVLDSADYALAIALTEVGEGAVGRSLLSALVSRHAVQPHTLAELARAASEAGLHDVALIAAIRLLGPLDPNERATAPRALELLAYPAPYAEEVLAAAEAEGIPPLLLLALVRQESAFNPEAGSTAGALGLTQVIPPTGAQIAASLGVAWDVEELFEPETSLRFGAHYLAAQLESFEGDLLAALGAYNGGPHNASRWYGLQWAPGPDGYIDAVDFTETRRYLTVVLENYAWYRYLYLRLEQPALP